MRSPRTRLAIGVGAVALAMGLSLATVLVSLPDQQPLALVMAASFLASPIVGGLLVVRQPGNRIGWLFLVSGLAFPAATLTEAWAHTALARGLPGVGEAAWFSEWLYFGFILPDAILIATFPTGRLPDRRLVPLLGTTLVSGMLTPAGAALGSRSFEVQGMSVPNPLRAPQPVDGWLLPVSEIANLVLIASATVFAVVLLMRLRFARGIERQQLKWFVAMAATIALMISVGLWLPSPLDDVAWSALVAAFGTGLPIATAIAILRYRLYDIDVVIRRTLVYAVVVVVLGVVYVALVLGLQMVLSAATGNDTLPVALSTLAIAALFGPVRAAVRGAIDRRFFRSRYDAGRTLEAYASRLRDEVELESVGRSLTAVAGEAVQPASASVWVRGRAT